MRIIHIADFEYQTKSGIGEVVLRLKKEQTQLGHCVYLFLISKQLTPELNNNDLIVTNLADFKNNISNILPDVVVFHSLYKFQYILYSRILIKSNIPYLIQPHGGTTIENAEKSKYKKLLANLFLFNKFISRSSAIIYLNENEKEKSVFKNLKSNYIIIPNGVDIYKNLQDNRQNNTKLLNILFLARIDIHHKGIDLLLQALNYLDSKHLLDQFQISFYGYGDNKSIEYLNKKISMIASNVSYKGAIWGTEKIKAYLNSDIYILTSRYEGMPMSILEALSFGIPCIITNQTNMTNIIKEFNCGWITDDNYLSIANTILYAIKDLKENKTEYKINSLRAAKEFDWKEIAKLSINQYILVI